MDEELKTQVGMTEDAQSVLDFVEKCIAVYEETVEASSPYIEEVKTQAIDRSFVEYNNYHNLTEENAYLPNYSSEY